MPITKWQSWAITIRGDTGDPVEVQLAASSATAALAAAESGKATVCAAPNPRVTAIRESGTVWVLS